MRLLSKFKSLMLSMLVFIAMVFAVGCTNVPDNNGNNSTTKAPVVQNESTTAAVEDGQDKTQATKETQAATKATQAATKETQAATKATEAATEAKLDKDGYYYSKDEVALYIHTYGKLPSNYITKAEAQKLGWTGGSVEKYAKDKAIGGDYFGNYEGLLPKKSGRKYTECDIDTHGANSRGAKRIIFSNDGLVYYTDNHYESFTLLYGTP